MFFSFFFSGGGGGVSNIAIRRTFLIVISLHV